MYHTQTRISDSYYIVALSLRVTPKTFPLLHAVLRGWQNDSDTHTVVGVTPIRIASEHCSTEPRSRYLCVGYVLTIVSTDDDASNDYHCTDISSLLACNYGEQPRRARILNLLNIK